MTPSSPPRRQQAEERREHILDAALRVFSEKGFAGGSIRDIAREAGITEGLIYHYFQSKDDLLYTCWKERSWHAQLGRILSRSEGRPVGEVLREVVADFMSTLRQHGENVRMCAVEMQRDAAFLSEHKARIKATHELLCDFLRSRQEAGELRTDCEVGAAAGMLMAAGYATFLVEGRSDEGSWDMITSNLVQDGVDVILRGIAA